MADATADRQIRQLAESLDIALMLRDVEPARYVYVSPAFDRILGYPGSRLLEDPHALLDIAHPDDLETVRSRLSSPPEDVADDVEWRIVRPDGTVRWVRAHSAFVVADEGQPARIAGFLEDVTDRKEAEMALQRARDEVQQASEAKSVFLSRMSHELRTPLNAVIGFGQLLELDELTPDQEESVRQILKGGRHLLDLINEVLDIARIESGEMRLSLEPVRLEDIVEESVSLVRHLAEERHVTVVNHCTGHGHHVRADRQRLTQVMLNLLTNAIKYNRENGQVAIECSPEDGARVRLTVSDTGIGIAAAHMNRLFAPFDRLGAEQTEVEGTGLGLALTRRLVEAMGGAIGATSVAGESSAFWVEFADVTSDDPLDVSCSGASESAVEAPPAQEGTILYIEDNLANVQLVERVLSQRPGVELVAAMQGSLGLELARSHRPDLVLLDLNLPDVSGVEVLRRLRADPATASIPVVVISADATANQVERLRQEGVVDYLSKPFDVRRFLAVVDEHAATRD